ncbi:MAG: hypothetical protein WA952_17830 [Lewinella sp.]
MSLLTLIRPASILFLALMTIAFATGLSAQQQTGLYARANLLRYVDLVNPGYHSGIGWKAGQLAIEASYAHLTDPYTNRSVHLERGRMIFLGLFREVGNPGNNRYSEVGFRLDHLSNRYRTVQKF